MASLHKQIDSHHIHGGWLYKKGVINRAWKKRYFVLFDDRTISYFEKEKHSKSRNKAKGAIHLTQTQRVELVQYVDPNLAASIQNFNQIVTNRNHSVDPKDKRKLKENGLKQRNYLHRATLGYLRQHTNPPKSNGTIQRLDGGKTLSKAKTVTPMGSSGGGRNRALSPSFTTDDMDTIFKFKQKVEKEEKENEEKAGKASKNLNHQHDDDHLLIKSVSPNRARLHTLGNDMLFSPSGTVTPKKDSQNGDAHHHAKDTKQELQDDIKFGLRQSRSASTDGSSDHGSDGDNPPDVIKGHRQRSSSAVDVPSNGVHNGHGVNGHCKNITPLDPNVMYLPLKQPLKKSRSQTTLMSTSPIQPKQRQLVPTFDDEKYTCEDVDENADENAVFLRMMSRDKTGKQRLSTLPKPPPRKSLTSTRSAPAYDPPFYSPSADFGQTPPQPRRVSALVLPEQVVPEEEEEEEKYAAGARTPDAIATNNQSLSPHAARAANTNMIKKRGKQTSSNRDIIVSDHIKQLHREQQAELSRSQVSTPNHAHDNSSTSNVFHQIVHEQQSDLTADRHFSFALIEPTRDWVLSAETERECQHWMNIFNKLVQGKPVYSGYLIKRGKNFKSWKKRWFVLFENKLLNYYQHRNITDKGCLIGDIDLRHAMWMRICHANEFKLNVADFFEVDDRDDELQQRSSSKLSLNGTALRSSRSSKNNLLSRNKRNTINVAPSSIGGMVAHASSPHQKSFSWQSKKNQKKSTDIFFEIATPNRTWIFGAQNLAIRNTWYAQIRDVFSDKLILKIYFDSPCNVQIAHAQQNLKQRYLALLKGWLIIFRDKNKLNEVRQMTFFQENIFRDYVRNKNCICIPLKNANIERRATATQHSISFQLKIQERCWYFEVDNDEILSKWMHLLSRTHRENVDVSQMEMSYSNQLPN